MKFAIAASANAPETPLKICVEAVSVWGSLYAFLTVGNVPIISVSVAAITESKGS